MTFNVLALACTVVLLVVMGYFALGCLPLLVLEHDTPLDARFIRNFFQLYYRAVVAASAAASLAYALAGQWGFSAGMLLLALVARASWQFVLPKMDAMRETMVPQDKAGIQRFRRLHIGGMAINGAQIAAVVGGLLWVKL